MTKKKAMQACLLLFQLVDGCVCSYYLFSIVFIELNRGNRQELHIDEFWAFAFFLCLGFSAWLSHKSTELPNAS